MCPILDFANHTNSSKHMLPVCTEAHHAPVLRKQNQSLSFISSRDGLKEGEEIFLYYGAHSNRTLFIEYAFVNELPDKTASAEDFNGEVDIVDIVGALFQRKGTVGVQMRTILQDKEYWGWALSFGYGLHASDQLPLVSDWTLHMCSNFGYPSFRLITALRLYSLQDPLEDESLRCWEDTLMGRRDIVSDDNDLLWRRVLLDICHELIQRAQTGISILNTSVSGEENRFWVSWAKNNIRTLWNEEALVAASVVDSIQNGVRFWIRFRVICPSFEYKKPSSTMQSRFGRRSWPTPRTTLVQLEFIALAGSQVYRRLSGAAPWSNGTATNLRFRTTVDVWLGFPQPLSYTSHCPRQDGRWTFSRYKGSKAVHSVR